MIKIQFLKSQEPHLMAQEPHRARGQGWPGACICADMLPAPFTPEESAA